MGFSNSKMHGEQILYLCLQEQNKPPEAFFTNKTFKFMGEYSIQDAIQQFLKKSRLKGGIQAMQIEEIWEKIMGKTISKYTDKIQIINHTLFISTQVGPLKNELLYQKDKIIDRVNEALGEKVVTDVVIK